MSPDRAYVSLSVGSSQAPIKFKTDSGDTLLTIENLQNTHANRNFIDTDVYIVNKSSFPLIGLQSSIDLELIKVTHSIVNNTHAMTNLGTEINKL